MSITLRPIQPKDNQEVGKMIQTVLDGENAPKTGTAYADEALFKLHGFYDSPRMAYFVVEENDRLLGGAGIGPLEGEPGICELQKMYFLTEARGRGIGTKMMTICLDFAHKHGYEKCYLETLPWMKAAQKLYKRSGFHYIGTRLGNTGHFSCNVWMLKEL